MVAIFVLSVFLSIILIDLLVLKIQGKIHPAFSTALTSESKSLLDFDGFIIPKNVFLSKGHTWISNNAKGSLCSVGVDNFASKAIGKISLSEVAEVGKKIKRGDVLLRCSNGNRTISFKTPISGVVKAVNKNFSAEKFNNPYEDWAVQILPENFQAETEKLLNGNNAVDWLKNEFNRMKDFVASHNPNIEAAGVTMYDGGTEMADEGFLVSKSLTSDFEKEFLSI